MQALADIESRAFRQAVEPAALGMIHAPRWLADMALRHRRVLAWPADQDALQALDLEFHLQLVRLSGNRFMIEAIEPRIVTAHQGDRRDMDELRRDLEDHLEMITLLQRGDPGAAARQLARHLDAA
jgi:DNA-binding GntR family transcriptional regulator